MSQPHSEELLKYPTGTVSGIVNTPEQLASTLGALSAAGFPEDAVRVLCGEAGARQIDASGAYHGLSGRLTRGVEHLFADVGELDRAEEALRAGHFVIGVAAPSDDEVQRAHEALRDSGARDVIRFGRWTTTTLEP